MSHAPTMTALRPLDVVLLSARFGLLAGLVEVVAVAIKRFALDTVVWLPWEVLWMSPLADVLLFTAAGIGIAGLGWLLPKWISPRVVLVLMSAAASFVVLLHVSSLAQWARVLLTLGIGTQLGRWLAARPTRVARLAAWPFRHRATPQTTPTAADSLDLPMSINRRALLVGTAGTVAGLAAGLHGGRWFSERKQLSRLAPMQKPPNVLFIVLDTVRAMSMSLHGNARRTTPELEKLAARGVLFERAIATAPWTLPSHASMFTGLYPGQTGCDWYEPLDSQPLVLSEAFNRLGYATGGFVANTSYCSREFGLHRGFAHYEDYLLDAGQLVRASVIGRKVTDSKRVRRTFSLHQTLGRKYAVDVNRSTLTWIERQSKAGRPFFAFLNYLDAHDPFYPRPGFEKRFSEDVPSDPRVEYTKRYSHEEAVRMHDAYEACLAGLDFDVCRLLADLEGRGLMENTLLVVTSDHGEQFDDHGLMGHMNSLYMELLHVPLMIVFPKRVPSGQRVSGNVSLADLPATVMDLLEVRENAFPGSSLASCWNSSAHSGDLTPCYSEVNRAMDWQPNWFPTWRGPIESLVLDSWHYFRYHDGSEELYDVAADPRELHDLARSESLEIPRLRRALDDARAKRGPAS